MNFKKYFWPVAIALGLSLPAAAGTVHMDLNQTASNGFGTHLRVGGEVIVSCDAGPLGVESINICYGVNGAMIGLNAVAPNTPIGPFSSASSTVIINNVNAYAPWQGMFGGRLPGPTIAAVSFLDAASGETIYGQLSLSASFEWDSFGMPFGVISFHSFDYNEAAPAAPEPSTVGYGLIALGIVAGGIRRRRVA